MINIDDHQNIKLKKTFSLKALSGHSKKQKENIINTFNNEKISKIDILYNSENEKNYENSPENTKYIEKKEANKNSEIFEKNKRKICREIKEKNKKKEIKNYIIYAEIYFKKF